MSVRTEAATAEELLERARALAPTLRERADDTEAQRRISDQTVSELRAAGLLRAVQPRVHGGSAAPFDAYVDILIELARGCPSTAWVCGQLASHSWVIGMFEEQAQADIWGSDPDAVSSGTLGPFGRATRTDGGYQLSGRWDFASGCDAAGWNLFGAMVKDEASGPPTRLVLLVPREQYTITETWFTGGLRGTGSNTLELNDVFVPAHRAARFDALNTGTGPGRELADAGPLPRLPLIAAWPYAVGATVIGAALALTEAFEDQLRAKLGQGPPGSSGDVGSQLRLAEALAEVDTAWLVTRSSTQRLMLGAINDEPLSIPERSLHRRNHAWAAELSVRAANRVYAATGAHGLYDSSPIGRLWRDANAARAHGSLVWDSPAESYARVRLGLEPNAKVM
jgi:resorcinol 4-hydroxylase (FADH2)